MEKHKPSFVRTSVLKRDIFSETEKGHASDDPSRMLVRRRYRAGPLWARPLALFLARREIRGLQASGGIEGASALAWLEDDAIVKEWVEGTPLHLSRPADAVFYRDAERLIRQLRRAGVTHNDLAKPQNWLMTPEGRAAIIDFQLASVHRSRGLLFRLLGYEDRRHLAKQKSAFAPGLMKPTEARLLATRSMPSRIWRASGKRLYNAVTRGVFRWSDGEGTGDRLDLEADAIAAAFRRDPSVSGIAIVPFPYPRKGTGLYAFVETPSAEPTDLDRLQKDHAGTARAELIQPVAALPRREGGDPRIDILNFVALNQMDQLEALLEREPEMASVVRPIAAARLNTSDRRLRG